MREQAEAAYDRASPERMQHIVAVARGLFMAHGFSATSMAAIAEAASIGKATLYANFTRKEDLFGAVVAAEGAMRGDALLDDESSLPLRETLSHVAHGFVAVLLSPTNVAMYRIIAAEAERFPELGRIFYEEGPARILAQLGRYLKRAMNDGLLREGPQMLVAAQFVGLIRADLQMRAMLGVDDPANPKGRKKVVDSGVDAFLRAYGSS